MIYSFYGKNDFLAILELETLIKDFKLKNYELYNYNFANYNSSISITNNENNDLNSKDDNRKDNFESTQKNILNQLFNNLNFVDLFSNNKLMVVKYLDEKNLNKKDLDFLKTSLQKIETDKNTVIVFLHRQKTLPAFLSKFKVKKQEFVDLKSNDLLTFIDNIANANNVKLSSQAKNLLVSFFGDNIGIIYNEIIKLSNYKQKIDVQDILDLIKEPNLSQDFGLTNALAEKNKKLAIKLLWQEYNAGTPDLLIFGNIVNHIRNAILIKEHQKTKTTHLDIHYFVQQKLLPFVKSFELKDLKIMLAQLFQYDLKIKKGKINAVLALELFINDSI